MSTNRRRKKKEQKFPITRECVELWLSGDEVGLGVALGLTPGHYPPAVHPDEECCYPPGTAGAGHWPAAKQIWLDLDEARKSFRIRRQPQ